MEAYCLQVKRVSKLQKFSQNQGQRCEKCCLVSWSDCVCILVKKVIFSFEKSHLRFLKSRVLASLEFIYWLLKDSVVFFSSYSFSNDNVFVFVCYGCFCFLTLATKFVLRQITGIIWRKSCARIKKTLCFNYFFVKKIN